MNLAALLLVFVAGIGTGLLGYLAGLASLISYPALLAVGLPPIAANATNTVGVASIGIGSSARATSALLERGRGHLLTQLAFAAVGGGIGAALLLIAGEGLFTKIVPWLIALGAVGLLISPSLSRLRAEPLPGWVFWLGLAVVAVYCGYFGAGAGTIYLAFAMLAGSDSLGREMAFKSAFLTAANIVAAVIFAFLAPIDWWAAIALGVGCLIGGNLGPAVQRRIPERVMRWTIGLAGLGLAVWLAVTS